MVKKHKEAAVSKSELVDILQSMEMRLKSDIRRIASTNVQTNEHLKTLGDRMATGFDGIRAETTARLESFSSRMETLWRETIVYPKILDEYGTVLRGHEQRIAALEARRSP